MSRKTGAVIVAAGMSSRMGGFKPMLKIGAITAARRVILTIRQAGIDTVVVVTGHNAEELEKHLSGMGAIYLRNDRYADSQMFDSAKIGLAYIQDHCDMVLFTPVDVPLFTAETVGRLLSEGGLLAVPVFGNRQGHPMLMASALIPSILAYRGEGGLAGAIQNCGHEKRLIRVDDVGILFDMDTPDDYRDLLRLHNDRLFRPQVQFRLAKEVPFFGPGTALLLKMILQTGSVKSACRMMQLSYSKGWNILKQIEGQLGYAVIERYPGGAGGGHTRLTEKGAKLLSDYERFEKEAMESVQKVFDRIFGASFF